MVGFKETCGAARGARLLPICLSVGLACADEPAAVGACEVAADCPESQTCVFLGANERDGVCITATPTPGFPGPGLLAIDISYFELDVLFVVDDSPAIAPRLPQLAGAMTAFAEALGAARPALSLRFGVTTTDAGNPQCATAAERGALRMESCRARLDEFVDDEAGVDAREACTAACSLEALALEPTPERDGELAPRPWLEAGPGWDNLPDGVGLAEALRCAVPQGVTGCEFTSPLASIEQAVARSLDEGDPAYGFVRGAADLLIVVISAGNDCSVAPGHEAIFSDNEVFWGDLQLPELSPGICWRAGVACDGPGPVYEGCGPVDRGDDGMTTTPEQAVLTSAQTFAELLKSWEDERETYKFGAQVRVFSVAGVPPGYAEGQAIGYADADDPGFQTQHGIGPGCSDEMAAPPPVRLLAAGDEFALAGLPAASICEPDWSEAFTRAAVTMSENLGPACYWRCVHDADPDTHELDPICDVIATNWAEDWSTSIPQCVRVDGGWVSQGGSPRCFVVRADNELDPRCAEQGYNLELELRATEPDPWGTTYVADCWLSSNPIGDCPKL
ncbi:hypothetical protein [Nannocystis punicea]|uniref:Uncharacterized protein n=1 Tax=Nannocystis punicea TaxID=2995304 RepID=A0ABY7GXI6_9BACT|nr:hypothetical protein [Nannocystis poenicansa]WAS91693.1 hypothetical protein O0S08_36390 [Nannocystis poenicansa]